MNQNELPTIDFTLRPPVAVAAMSAVLSVLAALVSVVAFGGF